VRPHFTFSSLARLYDHLRCQELNLSPGELALLEMLATLDRPTQTEVATALLIHVTDVSRRREKLVAAGYVTLERSPKNLTLAILSVTRDGRAFLSGAVERASERACSALFLTSQVKHLAELERAFRALEKNVISDYRQPLRPDQTPEPLPLSVQRARQHSRTYYQRHKKKLELPPKPVSNAPPFDKSKKGAKKGAKKR
jgi:DNA-binding MarR family transcriptional regulator